MLCYDEDAAYVNHFSVPHPATPSRGGTQTPDFPFSRVIFPSNSLPWQYQTPAVTARYCSRLKESVVPPKVPLLQVSLYFFKLGTKDNSDILTESSSGQKLEKQSQQGLTSKQQHHGSLLIPKIYNKQIKLMWSNKREQPH